MPQFFENFKILFLITTSKNITIALKKSFGVQMRPYGYTYRTPSRDGVLQSTRERRSALLDDYIVFLQEHEFDIGAVEDDPINFRQALESSKSREWIDAMSEEIKSMKDNGV